MRAIQILSLMAKQAAGEIGSFATGGEATASPRAQKIIPPKLPPPHIRALAKIPPPVRPTPPPPIDNPHPRFSDYKNNLNKFIQAPNEASRQNAYGKLMMQSKLNNYELPTTDAQDMQFLDRWHQHWSQLKNEGVIKKVPFDHPSQTWNNIINADEQLKRDFQSRYNDRGLNPKLGPQFLDTRRKMDLSDWLNGLPLDQDAINPNGGDNQFNQLKKMLDSSPVPETFK